MQQFYKVLNANGTCFHGGQGKWDIPKNGKSGVWREVEGKLVACRNAIHLVSRDQLVEWLGPAIFPIQPKGEVMLSNNKYICRKARLSGPAFTTWNERTARLLACDYAEHVLPVFEKELSGDLRVRRTIEVARRFANGNATKEELAAARAATWCAARAADGDAAWAAAGAAARAADGDATWCAARTAAWAATWDAAGAAEREWQMERLFDYLEGRVS